MVLSPALPSPNKLIPGIPQACATQGHCNKNNKGKGRGGIDVMYNLVKYVRNV